MVCHCNNVDFGSYDNTVGMKSPFDDWVSIDTCIATDIGRLWHNGVRTINSCCGHQKLEPSVIVSKDSYKKMDDLGYQSFINEFGAKIYYL